MPYIKPEDRPTIDDHMKRLEQHLKTPGDVNYAISKLMNDILRDRLVWRGKWGYADLNELIGALECAKLELYRRVAAPYEDGKILQNGDVYDCDKI